VDRHKRARAWKKGYGPFFTRISRKRGRTPFSGADTDGAGDRIARDGQEQVLFFFSEEPETHVNYPNAAAM
jgi:hypothetical protein